VIISKVCIAQSGSTLDCGGLCYRVSVLGLFIRSPS